MKTFKNPKSPSFSIFIAIIAILTISVGCSKKNDYNTTPSNPKGVTQGANEVFIQGSSFSPSTLTVTVNTTVIWTNKDSYAHTVTSDATMFDSGNMDSNDIYSFQFSTKGSYKYHCSYHSGMTGTIIVQ
jgi:plastocyanin